MYLELQGSGNASLSNEYSPLLNKFSEVKETEILTKKSGCASLTLIFYAIGIVASVLLISYNYKSRMSNSKIIAVDNVNEIHLILTNLHDRYPRYPFTV